MLGCISQRTPLRSIFIPTFDFQNCSLRHHPKKTFQKKKASYDSGVFEIFESSHTADSPTEKNKKAPALPPPLKIPLEFTHGNQNKFANPTSRKQVSAQKKMLTKYKITELVTKKESVRRALLVKDYICHISAALAKLLYLLPIIYTRPYVGIS